MKTALAFGRLPEFRPQSAVIGSAQDYAANLHIEPFMAQLDFVRLIPFLKTSNSYRRRQSLQPSLYADSTLLNSTHRTSKHSVM
jgi:hypothetical protein